MLKLCCCFFNWSKVLKHVGLILFLSTVNFNDDGIIIHVNSDNFLWKFPCGWQWHSYFSHCSRKEVLVWLVLFCVWSNFKLNTFFTRKFNSQGNRFSCGLNPMQSFLYFLQTMSRLTTCLCPVLLNKLIYHKHCQILKCGMYQFIYWKFKLLILVAGFELLWTSIFQLFSQLVQNNWGKYPHCVSFRVSASVCLCIN